MRQQLDSHDIFETHTLRARFGAAQLGGRTGQGCSELQLFKHNHTLRIRLCAAAFERGRTHGRQRVVRGACSNCYKNTARDAGARVPARAGSQAGSMRCSCGLKTVELLRMDAIMTTPAGGGMG